MPAACCLLPKDGSLPGVLEALGRSRGGGITVHPELLQTLTMSAPTQFSHLPTLTRREHDVLMKLAIGLDMRAIAPRPEISVNTCRGSVKSLMLKLGAAGQPRPPHSAVPGTGVSRSLQG